MATIQSTQLGPVRPIPYLRILQQPSHVYRMRYKAEKRNTFLYSEEYVNITNEKSFSDQEAANLKKIQFPKIEIVNGCGPATLIVSCVNKCEPYHVHPHRLVGEKCKSGVAIINIEKGEKYFELCGISIEFTKKQDFTESFNELKQKNVDPFNAGFSFDHSKIDLTQLRLCFQVYLRENLESNEIVRDPYHILRPIVSNIIANSSRKSTLQIVRAANMDSPSCGSTRPICIFFKKLEKDQRPLVAMFFDDTGWCFPIQIPENLIHNQCAVMFHAPPYYNKHITELKRVSFRIIVPFKSEKEKNEFILKRKKPNAEEGENNNDDDGESESTPTVDKYDSQHSKYETNVFEFIYTPLDVNLNKRRLDTTLFYDFHDQSEKDATNDISVEPRKKLAKRQLELNYSQEITKIPYLLEKSDPLTLNHSIRYAQDLNLLHENSIDNDVINLNQLQAEINMLLPENEHEQISSYGLKDDDNKSLIFNQETLESISSTPNEFVSFETLFQTGEFN